MDQLVKNIRDKVYHILKEYTHNEINVKDIVSQVLYDDGIILHGMRIDYAKSLNEDIIVKYNTHIKMGLLKVKQTTFLNMLDFITEIITTIYDQHQSLNKVYSPVFNTEDLSLKAKSKISIIKYRRK